MKRGSDTAELSLLLLTTLCFSTSACCLYTCFGVHVHVAERAFAVFLSSPLELLGGVPWGGRSVTSRKLRKCLKAPTSLLEAFARYSNTGILSLPLPCPSSSSSSFLFLSHSISPTLCLSLSLIHFHLFLRFSPCPTLHSVPHPSKMSKHQESERKR